MKTALYKCETCKRTVRWITKDGDSISLPCSCQPNSGYATTFKRVRGTTKDSVHRVFMPLHNARLVVDEDTSELDMRSAEPVFFSDHFGERETHSIYRGFVIMRYTSRYSDGHYERRTVVYAFGKWPRQRLGSHHITSDCTSIAQAKRLIDRILAANRWNRSES